MILGYLKSNPYTPTRLFRVHGTTLAGFNTLSPLRFLLSNISNLMVFYTTPIFQRGRTDERVEWGLVLS
jgi:hypothetical protein